MTATGSARGPGVLLVSATGLASAAVALDAGFALPAPLRAVLFAGWAAAVGVMGWVSLGRPGRRAAEAVPAGLLAAGAFGLAVLGLPGGGRAGRLAPPWPAPAPPALRVTTGEPVVVRGTGVTLACLAEPAAGVRLEVRTADGVEPHPTAEDPPGVFSARLPAVCRPLEYRFAADPAVTAWHRVTPADPVTLTAASEVRADPPGYAAGCFPVRRFAADEPAACLRDGRVTATLHFNRPAASVAATWQPVDDGPAEPLPADLAPDGRSATLAATVATAGRVELTLTADHGLQTAAALDVTAIADHPPVFVAVAGLEAGRWEVRPGSRLPLVVEVTDDAWAGPPTLSLITGSAPDVPVLLVPVGGGRYSGRLTVPVPANARLRLTDAAGQKADFPADDPAHFHTSDGAAPLAEQFALAHRDRVAARLVAGDPVGAAEAVAHVVELESLAAALRAGSLDLGGLADWNRRLAGERLDRLRLTELAADLRSGGDPSRFRDRLAAVVAGSSRLAAARAAADTERLRVAAAETSRLADDLAAAADALRGERVSRAAPLAARLGAAPGTASARQALLAGSPADALSPLAAAAGSLRERAMVVTKEADARSDPREAARQLAGWAKVVTPVERPRYEAAVSDLLHVTRRFRPSGCDSPERVARDFPAPAELRRQAVAVLRPFLDAPAGLADALAALPPGCESARTRLALLAACRPAPPAEVRWRLDLLIRELAGDAMPPDLPPGRLGLPPDADQASVRARLTGDDTDRDRLRCIVRWRASRSNPGTDDPRLLRDLLASFGGPPASLDRLTAEFDRDPTRGVPLVPVGPPPPTAAERLVHLDTGGRLPEHRTADALRAQAYLVQAVATEAALASADAERAAAAVGKQKQFRETLGRLRAAFDRPGVSPAVAVLFADVGRLLLEAGGDGWPAAVERLHGLPAVWSPGPAADAELLRLGRSLTRAAETVGGDDAARVSATRLLDAASR